MHWLHPGNVIHKKKKKNSDIGMQVPDIAFMAVMHAIDSAMEVPGEKSFG